VQGKVDLRHWLLLMHCANRVVELVGAVRTMTWRFAIHDYEPLVRLVLDERDCSDSLKLRWAPSSPCAVEVESMSEREWKIKEDSDGECRAIVPLVTFLQSMLR